MTLNYLFSLMLTFFLFQSIQAANEASREGVERGIEYIKIQDNIRTRLFRSNDRDGALIYTQNIYKLLKKPEKVSLIHHAKDEEKKAILKAIMASAIIHAPITIPAYPVPERVTENTVIPTDLSELHAGVGFPDFMEFFNPDKKDDYYVPPKGDLSVSEHAQLIKHFDILRVATIFSEAVARSIRHGIAIKSGYFNFLHQMLENSGVRHEDFFTWLQEVYSEIYAQNRAHFLEFEIQLDEIKNEYENNQGIEKSTLVSSNLIKIHTAFQGEEYKGTFAGINFNFRVQKVAGDGTCGYYALGITRDALKAYFINVLGELDKKQKVADILNTYTDKKLEISDDNEEYIKQINRYLTVSYLSTEEIELASTSESIISIGTCPNIVEEDKKRIWNQKPLREQIIGVWTYSRPGQLRLDSFYYNGGRIEVDVNNNIRSNTTRIPNSVFVEVLKEKMRRGECLNIYNNGVRGAGAHYDHLILNAD